MNAAVQTLQTSLQSTQAAVDGNVNRLNDHDTRLGGHDGDIGAMYGRIGANEGNINNLYTQQRDSHVYFAVAHNYFNYPMNTVVTFPDEYADTHNAMDNGGGVFYAPFTGAYAFFFFSQFYCYGESNVLYALRNDDQIAIFECQLEGGGHWISDTVYFTFSLNAGDRVRIYSGQVQLYSKGQFMGFLVQRY